VLTRTIPVTLTSRLPGGAHLDADAGLVYDGAGRFYDAALGLYLQPDPFGAAPEAPESLNRYAAPGVSTFPTVGSVPGGGRNHQDFTIELGLTAANKMLGRLTDLGVESISLVRQVRHMQQIQKGGMLGLEAAARTLKRKGLAQFFIDVGKGTKGRRAYVSREFVEQVGENVWRTLGGETVDLSALYTNRRLYPRWLSAPHFLENWVNVESWVAVPRHGAWTPVAKAGLKYGLAFGIDALWQLGADWDKDMPGTHKIARAGIAGGTGLVVGGATGFLLTVIIGGTPSGWVLLPVAVLVGMTIEPRINEELFKLVGVAHD
jgi:hypothetical protein